MESTLLIATTGIITWDIQRKGRNWNWEDYELVSHEIPNLFQEAGGCVRWFKKFLQISESYQEVSAHGNERLLH